MFSFSGAFDKLDKLWFSANLNKKNRVLKFSVILDRTKELNNFHMTMNVTKNKKRLLEKGKKYT